MNKHVIASLSLLPFAVVAQAAGIGGAAENVQPVTIAVSSIVQSIMYVAGIWMFVSSTMKYRIHRQNPQQIPISTPITEFVLAIVLIGVPLISTYGNTYLFANPHSHTMTPQDAQPVAPVR